MSEIPFHELRKYGKIIICSVFICLGLYIDECAAQAVSLKYNEAGEFEVQGQIEAGEWKDSKSTDKVLQKGERAKVATLYKLEVRVVDKSGPYNYYIGGFKKIDGKFLAVISHRNALINYNSKKAGKRLYVYVHGLKNPGEMKFTQTADVPEGIGIIRDLERDNFFIDSKNPDDISVNVKGDFPTISLYFKKVKPKQEEGNTVRPQAAEVKAKQNETIKEPREDSRTAADAKQKEKPRPLPMEKVENIPQVDSWRKNLLLRFYDKNNTVKADVIWKDLRAPFPISAAHKNKRVILTTPAGSVECKPKNGFIRWADCSKGLFIENTKDTDILSLLYKVRGEDKLSVYRILKGSKVDKKTRVNVPNLAYGNSSVWTVQVINREKNFEFYTQKLDMKKNTKINRTKKTLTVSTNPESIVSLTDERKRHIHTQFVDRNGKATFQLPATTEEVYVRIKKPGYFSVYKRYELLDADSEFELQLEMIPQIKVQNISERGLENLEKFGGSLLDLKVTVKNSDGKSMLEEPFGMVYTPLPVGSKRLELIDEKGRLIFKGNRLKKSIDLSPLADLSPSAKKVDLSIQLKSGVKPPSKDDLTLLINREHNKLKAGTGSDGITYSKRLELDINGEAYKSVTAYLCAKDFAPVVLSDLPPDPIENTKRIFATLEPLKPKVLIALSEYSTSDPNYYAIARDILKKDLAGELKKRQAVVGVLKKDGFQEKEFWGLEKPSFYGDTADIVEVLRGAARRISGRKDPCGQTLPRRMIYIGGDPGIKEVPEDFPDFYVISHQKRKSYPGAPGVPEKNWYQKKDKAGILRTLESLL